ncbi:hypothetical protein A374_08599 [Fictibacillus macauensis ZFHKF-1]|uniref:ABC transporter ATP-binding protein n=1 Tax=Fictibacillus macauensis ZFHKF-1 TaxID=1196324 RepID=I8J2B1_9BACL|nr:ABC transporter ATP-binding protein [Fictibacillus macauensis]EIT85881.1 hypothetical protein A374_08599 [Fictibacillus macauensis ZFHKF-1]
MNSMKRLYHYAAQYKKTFSLALLLLALAVGTELTGPFIGKALIDRHILGIEQTWYEGSPKENHAVLYGGKAYIRGDHVSSARKQREQVSIVQTGHDYYFVKGAIQHKGEKSYQNGKLIIKNGKKQTEYNAIALSNKQIWAFYQPEVPGVIALISLYAVLLLLAGVFHYGQRYLLLRSSNLVVKKLRQDVFKRLQQLPVSFFDSQQAGTIVSKVTNDTEAIKELFVNVLAHFFTGIVYMVGIFIALFLLDVRLACICLILIPIMVLWIRFYRKLASRYNRKLRELYGVINGMIYESIQGLPIIRTFTAGKRVQAQFEQENKAYFTYQKKLLNLDSFTSHNLVGVLRNLSFVAVIWYFGSNLLNHQLLISAGVLYAFVDYLTRLFEPITGMVEQLSRMEQSLTAAERVFALLDEKGTKVGSAATSRLRGDVVFQNVNFSYQPEEPVLKNLSFHAKSGETIALVGHTGSGKSSILNVLLRYYEQYDGQIFLDGQDMRAMSAQQVRSQVGIVLQEPYLFTGTIASNVSLGNPDISREQIVQALADVGALAFVEALPMGLDEPVLEKGSTLSAGERQLLSFARALVINPAILVLDEATANIDTETESIIQHALRVVQKNRTTFVIAHRLSTIKEANQILVLKNGIISEQGTHEELMQDQGYYYQMYQLQHGVKR